MTAANLTAISLVLFIKEGKWTTLLPLIFTGTPLSLFNREAEL